MLHRAALYYRFPHIIHASILSSIWIMIELKDNNLWEVDIVARELANMQAEKSI